MIEDKQDTRWFIESSDQTINVSHLYQTLKEMNLAVETAEFSDPDDPTKKHYTVEVKFIMVKMLANKKKADFQGIVYHVWRKTGGGKYENVDNIFIRKLSRKATATKKQLKELCEKKGKNCSF